MAINFNRNAADFVNLGDISTARGERATAWTVLAFFRIEDSTTDDHAIISKLADGSNVNYWIKVDAQTAPTNLEIFLGGTWAAEEITGGNNIALNTWYLAAISCNGTSTANDCTLNLLGMDGTFLDNALTGTHSGDPTTMTGATHIGKRANDTGDPADGDIAYVAYVDAELSQAEILEYLHNPISAAMRFKTDYGMQYFLELNGEAVEVDISGNKNNGTTNGSPVHSENPPVGADMVFSSGHFFEFVAAGGGGPAAVGVPSAAALKTLGLTGVGM